MPKIKSILKFAAILSVIILIAGWAWLRSSLPLTHGSLSVSGSEDTIKIVRDNKGIPHIKATSLKDAYFGLGFVHAQDRLWQMEMNRRIAQGRLAEVVGASGLGTDKFLRTLGVYARAKDAWVSLNPETKAIFEAYAAGVNAFLDQQGGALPPEFILTQHSNIEPWSPIDSIAWTKMMAWDLSGNWRKELNRLQMWYNFDESKIDEFYPPYRYETRKPLPDLDDIYDGLDLKPSHQAWVDQQEDGLGSNNWVVNGSRTVTGKPLLANDPHLGLTTPSVWYLAHLAVGDENLVGSTLPGVPQVVLGRNNYAAWGFTNTGPDVQDLYFERVSRDDETRYETPTGTDNFNTRREVIKVKDGDDVVLNVRETRHGPVISDVMDDLKASLPSNLVVSFRWTALDKTDSTPTSVNGTLTMRSLDDFVSNMRAFHAPEQNMIFANIDGDIGYFAPASVPIRHPDNKLWGHVPALGWDATYDWQGYIPVDELPKTLNPEKGYVATANAKIVDNDYPHFLGDDWAYPYRTERIVELLEATPKHSIESFVELIMDDKSVMAEELLPLMLPHIPESDIKTMLSNWDYAMDRNKAEPLIYMNIHRHLIKHIIEDDFADDFSSKWHQRPEFLLNVLTNKDGQGHWCDDQRTAEMETCGGMVATATAAALAELNEQHGANWQAWRWGDLHVARNAHTPFSQVSALQSIFDNVIEVDGGPYTVNVTNVRFNRNRNPFETSHGASYRAIYDLSNLDNSRYIYPAGQSGNLFSDHYNNLTEDWSNGTFFTISTDMSELEKQYQNQTVVLNKK